MVTAPRRGVAIRDENGFSMSSSPKVSIVVPIYNAEKYLERCLESLVRQTFKEIEILCVNDGSTDGSQEIIDEFAERYPGMVVSLPKANGGVADARNYGLKQVQTEYVTFMDNDDWVDPGWIEKLYTGARKESADMVVGDIEIAGDDKEYLSIPAVFTSKAKQMLDRHEVWNKLFNMSLFLQNDISFPVGSWCDDLATTPKLIALAKKIIHVNGPCYYYYQHRDAFSKNTPLDRLNDQVAAVENLYEYFDREKILPDYNDELEFIYIRELILFYMFAYAHSMNPSSMMKKLKSLEEIIRRKFPDYKRNKYINNKNVLNRNFFLSWRCYFINRFFYVMVVKLRVMIKMVLLRIKGS